MCYTWIQLLYVIRAFLETAFFSSLLSKRSRGPWHFSKLDRGSTRSLRNISGLMKRFSFLMSDDGSNKQTFHSLDANLFRYVCRGRDILPLNPQQHRLTVMQRWLYIGDNERENMKVSGAELDGRNTSYCGGDDDDDVPKALWVLSWLWRVHNISILILNIASSIWSRWYSSMVWCCTKWFKSGFPLCLCTGMDAGGQNGNLPSPPPPPKWQESWKSRFVETFLLSQ